ncbi:MAG: helix-turn-helix transcriptional regulator, partial [Lachnospiraceae bacterium]|nr:helix-turn-helix transcriptional regulator [Lachnospiraceae bacterium]
LSKYIKERSGKTFGEHLTSIRMRRAKTLLKNGNMSIENVAFTAGYQNAEHFSRQFKKMYGMSPSSYRDMQK